MYVLIGRVFALLPISADMAVRINYVSVVSSALAAGMAFFVMTRLIRDALVGDLAVEIIACGFPKLLGGRLDV